MDIKSLSHEMLVLWLERKSLAAYRADQIFKWVYQKQADTFDQMTDLNKPTREILSRHFTIDRLKTTCIEHSADGSQKFLFELSDGEHIESVLIPERDHDTLCVSSQVGCAMGCEFCVTGRFGLKRNLGPNEILSQVRDVQKQMADPQRLTNIVFMGMGEPLANYDNLLQALRILTDNDRGLRFSTRRVTVSTAGLAPKITRLGADIGVNLAVSLNAVDNRTRSRLMPINERYSIEALLAACRQFPIKAHRRITFEYILIEGINDTSEDARKLANLLRAIPAKINLIPYNPHEGSRFARPSKETIDTFQQILLARNYTAIIRKSKGQDISAACGQLKAKKGQSPCRL